jgi:hypothetical protein
MEIGTLCWHPTFGVCRVILLDPRGLVQVRWPEYSSSQAFFSLVEPGTLKEMNHDQA